MKRSKINQLISEAVDFLHQYRVSLPPWAHWSPQEWARQPAEKVASLQAQKIGWDVSAGFTDDFDRSGLLLITLRNGDPIHPSKPYAEKLIIQQPQQVCPFHYHRSKLEDIINRGGGELCFRFRSSACYPAQDGAFVLDVDGMPCSVKEDEELRLQPGQSLTVPRGLFHSFWVEGGKVLIGEVSTINDDVHDNFFLEQGMQRFPTVEEDEGPRYLLVSDYPSA